MPDWTLRVDTERGEAVTPPAVRHHNYTGQDPAVVGEKSAGTLRMDLVEERCSRRRDDRRMNAAAGPLKPPVEIRNLVAL